VSPYHNSASHLSAVTVPTRKPDFIFPRNDDFIEFGEGDRTVDDCRPKGAWQQVAFVLSVANTLITYWKWRYRTGGSG